MRHLLRRSLALSLLALGAGCDLPSPDEVETHGGALTRGYFSFADPAVGILSPSGCTATLIDPQAVVTAGHCVNWVTGPVSGTFSVDLDAATRVPFAVERVRSFGRYYGHDDVSVIRLAQPVPASVARPLALHSSAIISMHEHTTMYGYGCRSGSRDEYTGRKQRLDTRYGLDIYGCPGDSGGPFIKTFPSGLRAVSKLMSAILKHGFWPWEDEPEMWYGLVYKHAVAIANQADAWAGRPPGSSGVTPPRGGGGRGPNDPPIREN
jgi:hypothetical protein